MENWKCSSRGWREVLGAQERKEHGHDTKFTDLDCVSLADAIRLAARVFSPVPPAEMGA